MSKYIASITPERSSLIVIAGLMIPELKDESVKRTVSIGFSNTKDVPKHLFINGAPYDESHPMMTDVWPYIFTIRIDHTQEIFPEAVLDVKFSSTTGLEFTNVMRIYVSSSDSRVLSGYDRDGNQIDSSLSSFMLMRTNPKLTGNIKLVIDSQDKLYLDTFKVSKPLWDRIYRKYPVSSEGNYPFDVMTVFSKLPRQELFRLPGDSLNPHKVFTSYEEQYLTEYEYGAETNADDMYSENMRLLAPLHLGKNVPDFFCIFRYRGVMNQETYNSVVSDDTERLKSIISDCDVVRIVDLRNYTAAGQYLRNYQRMISPFLYGSCYLQFIEQENADDILNIRQGTDSWRGIDVSRGLITNMLESSYFKTLVINGSIGVQERFNNYILNGYERNNVLYPYILNMEFMFNDPQGGDEFKMNRYFGLYLTENMLVRYDSIIRYMSSGAVYYSDESGEPVKDAYIRDTVSSDDLKDRIFFMTTNNDARRVSSQSDIDTFVSNYVLNNPDRHIATLRVKEKTWADDEKSFISMKMTKQIKYGEHIRLILRNIRHRDELRNICFDLIASNDERLRLTVDNISPYFQTSTPQTHADASPDTVVLTDIFRISFYTQSLTDPTALASLDEQLQRLAAAIRRYVPVIHVKSVTKDSLGLVSSHTDVWVQHLLSVNSVRMPQFRYLSAGDKDDKVSIVWGGSSEESSPYMLRLAEKLALHLGKSIYPKYNADIYYQQNSVYTNFSETEYHPERFIAYPEYGADDSVTVDPIRYYNPDMTIKMSPLSPDTWWYSPEYAAFSLSQLESLGWRWSSLVKFMNTSVMQSLWTVYDNLDELTLAVRHPIVKSEDGMFYPAGDFEFTSGYLTDNALLLMVNEQWHTHTQEIITNNISGISIMSPDEPDYKMLTFGTSLESWKPFVHNAQLQVFNPESAQLSIMGITPVKDFDMFIGSDRTETVSSKDKIVIPAGDIVYIDSPEDDRIKSNIVYTVESGSFSGYSFYMFVVCEGDVYYTMHPDDTETHMSSISGKSIVADTDVTLVLDIQNTRIFEFERRIPGQSPDNFLVDPNAPMTSRFSIPVVPQTNVLWQSNGMYFDGIPVLDVSTIAAPYTQKGYFTEHSFSLSHDGRAAEYSTDSFATVDGKNIKFRDIIVKQQLRDAIRKMLISNYPIQTAVGYYNPSVQSLEFIYYGIKFTIKFNSDYYNNNIRIGDYNNFDVYVIDEYAPDEENEIYISTVEEIILIVNHKFTSSGGADGRRSGQIYNIKSGHGIDGTNDYKVSLSPYRIYPDTICGYGDTSAGESSMVCRRDASSGSVIDASGWFVQEDFPDDIYAEDSSSLPSHYVYFPGAYADTRQSVVNVPGDLTGILSRSNKEAGDVSTVAFSEAGHTFIDNYVDLTGQNRRQKRAFVATETTGVKTDVCNCSNDSVALDEYIDSMNGVFHCYIITENSTDEFLISEDYKPVIISMTRPERIKFNFGYFVPRTYDIISTAQNDYTVASRCRISLLLSGTQIEKVSKLNSYTGNMIIPETVSRAIEKNYFVIQDWSIMQSNWDSKYYRTYSEDGTYKLLDGYIPGIEDKAFIGSRCMILKSDHIVLNDFSAVRIGAKVEYVTSGYNEQSKSVRECRMTINITLAIYYLFESSQAFIDNWADFGGDIETSVRNYIKNSVSKIYNRQRRREISLLAVRDPEITEMDVVFAEPSQEYQWEEIDDYNTQMTVSQNDEMILVITMKEKPGYKVHPVVKIYRTI